MLDRNSTQDKTMRRMPEMLTPETVARLLEVDEEAITSAIAAGELPALEVGGQYRIQIDAYLAWIGAPEKARMHKWTSALLAVGLVLCAGSAVGFELGQDASSHISNDIPRVLPFEGSYTLDGQPIDASVPMSFDLYSVESGGTPVWTSDNRMVNVSDGRFAVTLGDANDVTPIPEDLFASSSIYLEVVAEGNSLTPRQRLAPAPQAVSAARAASDFDVPGNLDAQGNINVDGTLDVSAKSTFSTIDVISSATFRGGVNLGNAANDTISVAGELDVTGESVFNAPISGLANGITILPSIGIGNMGTLSGSPQVPITIAPNDGKHFCALASQAVDKANGSATVHISSCSVNPVGGNWELEYNAQNGNLVSCHAICMRFE